MILFRIFLSALLAFVVLYTIPVVLEHGLMVLMPTFFGDMMQMTWAGQFNADFVCFLALSALWTAWRNEFSAGGLALSVVAFFGGFPFLSVYLLVLLGQSGGDIQVVMLGARRATA